MQKDFIHFFDELEKDSDLRRRFESSKSFEEAFEIAKPYLKNCRFEEFKKYLLVVASKLSNRLIKIDEMELESIVGGAGYREIMDYFSNSKRIAVLALTSVLAFGIIPSGASAMQNQAPNIIVKQDAIKQDQNDKYNKENYIYESFEGGVVITGVKEGVKIFAPPGEINGLSVIQIGKGQTLENLSKIEAIDLSKCENVSIGDWAFAFCKPVVVDGIRKIQGKENLSLKDKVDLSQCKSIGYGAFFACSNLTGVDLSQCTSIGESAFAHCSGLKDLDLSKCTNIGGQAFYDCSQLTGKIDLSKCISIRENAFSGCSNLACITNLSQCMSIGKGAFCKCSNLMGDLDLSQCMSIGTQAFYKCSKLKGNLDLKNCYYIGEEAFKGCENLTNKPDLNGFKVNQEFNEEIYKNFDISWYKNKDDNEFTIATENQLWGLTVLVNLRGMDFKGKTIKLRNDINMEHIWIPIGNNNNPFAGTFDGNNKKISKLITDETKNHQGLFGVNIGIIENIRVVDTNIKGIKYIGGVVGYNYGTIKNSYHAGNIKGENDLGGIAGYNLGTITNSYQEGDVSGKDNVGGVVGYNYGTIKNSYHIGNIEGKNDVGGVVGCNLGKITDSYNMGKIKGENNIGGIAGFNSNSTIINSYNVGEVEGFVYVGGIAGSNKKGTITNSYNAAEVKGGIYVGGVAGGNEKTIENSCNSGEIKGNDLVGGVVGLNFDRIVNSYNLGHIIAKYLVGGVVGTNIGQIENIYNKGDIKGVECIGGVVGLNKKGSIKNSYNTRSVKGEKRYVGGAVGLNSSGIIENSYNIGNIEGMSYVGGVVSASENGTIRNIYNIGNVKGTTIVGGIIGVSSKEIIKNSYYCNDEDKVIVTKDIATPVGEGKTLDEMKKLENLPGLKEGFREVNSQISQGYPILNFQLDFTEEDENKILVERNQKIIELKNLKIDLFIDLFIDDVD